VSENDKRRVLIVDDDEGQRSAMGQLLSSWGYETLTAVDGRDALEKLGNFAADTIITDLNMPNLDGIGLIRSVRANPRWKGIPIIMLTTESHETRKQEGRAAGATGWIVKPFTTQQLLSVVKKVLG